MSAISELKNPPKWLTEARTENANVEITASGLVIWYGGNWYGGVWHGGDCGDWYGGNWYGGVWRDGNWYGGDWYGGVWRGGVWRGGDWHGGDWYGGVWRDGNWHGGVWRGGVWRGGDWHGGDWYGGVWRVGNWYGGDWYGGVWHGGVWRGVENRLDYMAAIVGIVFDAEGIGIAYRSTRSDGHGRHVPEFVQPEGEYFEDDLPPSGSGTCVPGIHVSSAATAWSYFGVDRTAQLWRVKFKREDLLDCDGEKARIRGGYFERVPWPFLGGGAK